MPLLFVIPLVIFMGLVIVFLLSRVDDQYGRINALECQLKMDKVREVTRVEAEYIHSIIPDKIRGATGMTTPDNLRLMLMNVIKHGQDWPIEMSFNVIGFTRGVLVRSNLPEVREMSEHLHRCYKEAYSTMGLPLPEGNLLEPRHDRS